MQLIGMLDSPYVRRVAIVMLRLELPFEHKPISLFRHIDEFRRYNPLLKAPTLIADDGTALMDSTLIIDYLVSLAPRGEQLLPSGAAARLAAARSIGLSLMVCEKAVQAHYERALRPVEKQHEPWKARIHAQLLTGLDMLEKDVAACDGRLFENRLTLPDISLACAFGFAQLALADIVDRARYRAIASFCARVEALPEFLAAPALDGVQAPVR
jgi:glutathione S-transferase